MFSRRSNAEIPALYGIEKWREGIRQAIAQNNVRELAIILEDNSRWIHVNTFDVDSACEQKLLHFAVGHGSNDIILFLINEWNAIVDIRNGYNDTPLMSAVINGSPTETCRILLENGASVNATSGRGGSQGSTVVHFAALKKREDILALIFDLALPCNINGQTRSGVTALQLFVSHGECNVSAVQSLVRLGANVHLQDNRGWTALHYAASHNKNPKVLQALIDAGSQVNRQCNRGRTALHVAGCVPAAQVLIENGSDIDAHDNEGRTPEGGFAIQLSMGFERGGMQDGRFELCRQVLMYLRLVRAYRSTTEQWEPVLAANSVSHEHRRLERDADMQQNQTTGNAERVSYLLPKAVHQLLRTAEGKAVAFAGIRKNLSRKVC